MSEARDEVFAYMQYANDYYMGDGDPNEVLRESLDTYVAEETARLRAEIEQTRWRVGQSAAVGRDLLRQRNEAEDTIERVRAVVDEFADKSAFDPQHDLWLAVRAALSDRAQP